MNALSLKGSIWIIPDSPNTGFILAQTSRRSPQGQVMASDPGVVADALEGDFVLATLAALVALGLLAVGLEGLQLAGQERQTGAVVHAGVLADEGDVLVLAHALQQLVADLGRADGGGLGGLGGAGGAGVAVDDHLGLVDEVAVAVLVEEADVEAQVLLADDLLHDADAPGLLHDGLATTTALEEFAGEGGLLPAVVAVAGLGLDVQTTGVFGPVGVLQAQGAEGDERDGDHAAHGISLVRVAVDSAKGRLSGRGGLGLLGVDAGDGFDELLAHVRGGRAVVPVDGTPTREPEAGSDGQQEQQGEDQALEQGLQPPRGQPEQEPGDAEADGELGQGDGTRRDVDAFFGGHYGLLRSGLCCLEVDNILGTAGRKPRNASMRQGALAPCSVTPDSATVDFLVGGIPVFLLSVDVVVVVATTSDDPVRSIERVVQLRGHGTHEGGLAHRLLLPPGTHQVPSQSTPALAAGVEFHPLTILILDHVTVTGVLVDASGEFCPRVLLAQDGLGVLLDDGFLLTTSFEDGLSPGIHLGGVDAETSHDRIAVIAHGAEGPVGLVQGPVAIFLRAVGSRDVTTFTTLVPVRGVLPPPHFEDFLLSQLHHASLELCVDAVDDQGALVAEFTIVFHGRGGQATPLATEVLDASQTTGGTLVLLPGLVTSLPLEAGLSQGLDEEVTHDLRPVVLFLEAGLDVELLLEHAESDVMHGMHDVASAEATILALAGDPATPVDCLGQRVALLVVLHSPSQRVGLHQHLPTVVVGNKLVDAQFQLDSSHPLGVLLHGERVVGVGVHTRSVPEQGPRLGPPLPVFTLIPHGRIREVSRVGPDDDLLGTVDGVLVENSQSECVPEDLVSHRTTIHDGSHSSEDSSLPEGSHTHRTTRVDFEVSQTFFGLDRTRELVSFGFDTPEAIVHAGGEDVEDALVGGDTDNVTVIISLDGEAVIRVHVDATRRKEALTRSSSREAEQTTRQNRGVAPDSNFLTRLVALGDASAGLHLIVDLDFQLVPVEASTLGSTPESVPEVGGQMLTRQRDGHGVDVVALVLHVGDEVVDHGEFFAVFDHAAQDAHDTTTGDLGVAFVDETLQFVLVGSSAFELDRSHDLVARIVLRLDVLVATRVVGWNSELEDLEVQRVLAFLEATQDADVHLQDGRLFDLALPRTLDLTRVHDDVVGHVERDRLRDALAELTLLTQCGNLDAVSLSDVHRCTVDVVVVSTVRATLLCLVVPILPAEDRSPILTETSLGEHHTNTLKVPVGDERSSQPLTVAVEAHIVREGTEQGLTDSTVPPPGELALGRQEAQVTEEAPLL